MKKEIAFFDFDGTITTKDTLLEFIKFSKGHFRFYLGFILHLPFLIAFKIKLISNQTAKEKILKFFFSKMSVEEFKKYCTAFSKNILPKLIRGEAEEEISRLQRRNVIVVIVSASPENWIRDWASEIKAELIASRLEIKNGKLTGKILGKNCHGNEKVNRINETYDLTKYHVVAAYGDSSGDKPMLQLAANAFYRPFAK